LAPEQTEAVKDQSAALRIWQRLPAVAAFVLLACQAALPWTAPHFVTGDGPSHLYGATIARELIFHHRHSVYAAIYTIQRAILPNWTATFVLAATEAIAGTDHAEALFASLAVVTGFFGLSYMKHALAPHESPWTPVSNFLLQSWFLWIGFYNFYLGMILVPFLIGYYLRHAGKVTGSRTAMLSAGLTLLFFTHMIALAIALTAMGTVAVWRGVLVPAVKKRQLPGMSAWREPAWVVVAAVPALILTGIYMYTHNGTGGNVPAGAVRALFLAFPQQVFQTGAGMWGKQDLLWKLVSGYILAACVLMRREEWGGARGGIVVAAGLCFLGYLFIPDEGFGGSAVIVRFAWGVFILGGVAALNVARLRVITVPFALCVAALLAANVAATARAARILSHAVDSYLATARALPEGSTVVRLFYPAPAAPERYGYSDAARFPFMHLDALVASEKHALDITDYEPLTRLFPVVQKKAFAGEESQLWGFEGPDPDAVTTLQWLGNVFPRRIEFVLLFGEEQSGAAQKAGMPTMAAWLSSKMQLLATSSDGLLRLYGRR